MTPISFVFFPVLSWRSAAWLAMPSFLSSSHFFGSFVTGENRFLEQQPCRTAFWLDFGFASGCSQFKSTKFFFSH